MGFKKYVGKVGKNIKEYYSPEAREERTSEAKIKSQEKHEERIQSFDRQIEEEKKLSKLRGFRRKHQPRMIRKKGSVSAPFATHSPIFGGGLGDGGGVSEVMPGFSEPKKKKKNGGLFDF